jgi:hypothetical protein
MIRKTIALAMAAMTLLATPAWAGDGRAGGKLRLTDGISTVEGSAGGGLATWAVIAGEETVNGIGGTAHATIVALPEFDLESYGAAVGLWDRVELSYAHQSFDTRKAGAALGLGRGFVFAQDIFGAKVRVLGDALWDQDRWLPQISVGVQHKVADKQAVIAAVGGRDNQGTDFLVSATKIFLSRGIVAGGTVRWTKANQLGLLGHGGDAGGKRSVQVEASAAKMLSPTLVVGGEFRSKPDNLGFAEEDDVYDIFATWSVSRRLTLTAAYVDLGDIATVKSQRGGLLSLQAAF